jgi:hypothetical protein
VLVRLVAREPLRKGKVQYCWPPCTYQFNSAPYAIEKNSIFSKKTGYLNEEVNYTKPSSLVSFLSSGLPRNTKGGSITVPLTSCLTGSESAVWQLTTDNFCFYLLNRLIQTSETGGQQYSDTSPLSIPWVYL